MAQVESRRNDEIVPYQSVVIVALMALAFMLGLAIGNGRATSDALYRQHYHTVTTLCKGQNTAQCYKEWQALQAQERS